MRKLPGLTGSVRLGALIGICSLVMWGAGCAGDVEGGPGDAPVQDVPDEGGGDSLVLLGSKHGGHAWFDFCEGQPDSAALPGDPRALVQPGVSDGKAVHFNAWWKDCHVDPELVGEQPHPETCGELRESWERGRQLMVGNGAVGAGTFFAGTEPSGFLSFPADIYNNLWVTWGLPGRPDNFDYLVAERFGVPLGTERNPYPLPGEDPNAVDGGSGQLPINMTQTRNADGSWSGNIGLTCHGCHSGEVGSPADGHALGALYGSGTGLPDIGVIARDLAIAGAPPMGIFALFGASRGTNNAQFANITAIPSPADSGAAFGQQFAGWVTSGSTASMDTPAWWNLGHRPAKFIDGVVPTDAVRVDMAFYTPLLDNRPVPTGQDAGAWVRAHDQAADHWMLSLKAPTYPMEIDEDLARQGALLFHVKDLWAGNSGNTVPRPDGGNGSCASCHGAYSPHFVNDPAFLADPALEGVASYIVPMDIIQTDPERMHAFNEAVQQSSGSGFVGYEETVGSDQDCGAQNRDDLRGDRELGYLAPPLYGIWATAPYLHNGSVPDVWSLLKSDERPAIWRRVSEPAREDQVGQVVMGFDTDLERAYDPERMGWSYDALACGDGTIPLLDCDPLQPEQDPLLQQILSELYGNVLLTWNLGNATVLAQWTPQQIENRKIYNTHLFSQDNGGHVFSDVLTDAERRAIIEYLKTL